MIIRTCLITGATGGIGKELCIKFAKEGYNLVITSTNKEKLKDLKKELISIYNIKVYIKIADLSTRKGTKKLLEYIENKNILIDILINNAGTFIVKSLEELKVKDLNKTFNLNVITPFILSQELSKNMKKQGWGRIINIGSSSAYGCSKDTIAYSMSKHALLGLSKGLFEELSEFNVRTYIVSPAGTKTNMGKKIKNQNFDNFVLPNEIAEYILFIIKFNSTMISNEIRLNRMTLG